ncbi:hypothetical protein J7443_17915 [Tropicibacter sp. R15_0]|uniref:P-loop NTPase fold protein n=1 Tax=Tropicibacter sp. R15_0 TaxID=2821101 RepID=UPI001AD9EDA7|nr:P-loop NTPase fold protein [Tropicibacter sp. R15_0]MBO9467124.1 hypothetical protein [Tropicibacter sp. R15_0]
MSNDTVKAVVDAYLQREDPGYALLIDAPWGAGKTHFIKRFINHETNDPLYVTLYDVQTAEAFEWALVRAALPKEDARGTFSRLLESLGNLKVGDGNVNLGKLGSVGMTLWTEHRLANLPNTLIFDDIERCGLSQKQLSGLINRFVEHQGKRVILLANSDKHSDKESFDTGREKLIGQTVTLKADLNAALAAVWAKIPDGQGKTVLQDRQNLIKETFDEAKHQNLRLTLRAVRDCAVMLDALTEEMLGFEEAVERLIRTHLALHMAYHGGEIGKEDLVSRNKSYDKLPRPKTDETKAENTASQTSVPPIIWPIVERHPGADIHLRVRQGSLGIISVELGCSLFFDGYASTELTLRELRETHLFTPPAQRPDWVRLWHWDEESVHDLKSLLDRIEDSINNHTLVEPGEILQVYAVLNRFGEYSERFPEKENTRRFCAYINALIEKDLIRKRSPQGGDHGKYGFSLETGTISYGGYGFEPDLRARILAKKLRGAMDAAYERDLPQIGRDLVNDLRDDPAQFQACFDYQTKGLNFSEAPILQACDVQAFASALLEWYEKDKGVAQNIAKVIGKRSAGIRQELALEHPWIENLKSEFITQAAAKDRLLAAQVKLFIKRYMKPD